MLQNVKLVLGIADGTQDDLLNVLVNNAMNYVLLYLDVDELPNKLNFIVEELTIIKYRKMGSEGIKTEKIDVLSTTYTSDDLAPYITILDNYKEVHVKNIHKARFI